jgi:RNA-splicing ligase RtcB
MKEKIMSDLKIFTEVIEPEATNQIYTLIKQPAFQDCKVRIMPDVHAGAGCVIGFTADLGNKVIPNIVGVDIGCGMLTVELGKIDIDFEKLDDVVRKYVPSGREVHEGRIVKFDKLQELYCYRELSDTKRMERSIGTLGGGNHFIEVDKDDEGNKYLVIHSGSRNLGKQVADYYQNLAIDLMQGKDELFAKQEKLIQEYKANGRRKEIQSAIKELHRTFQPNKLGIPKELCYLEGEYREKYLHDMRICQEYATLNRQTMAYLIVSNMFGDYKLNTFETIHNYIDHDSNIVRKGAVSAKKDEILLIPINMRDGSLICKGKGNDDWNQSAPHGAGRLMSRSKAKEILSVEDFENTMDGIFTTCVGQSTLDESPMAYKSMDDIINNIGDTVDVLKVIKPIYNFKASE